MPTVQQQVEAEIMADEPYNAADEKQVNNARKKKARREKERLEVMEALLQNQKTRAWLWDLIEGYNPYGEFMVPGDVPATYFNWGMRNAGIKLLQDAMQFPDLFTKMANEARSRK